MPAIRRSALLLIAALAALTMVPAPSRAQDGSENPRKTCSRWTASAKYWWINVEAPTAGSSPTIVGTSCFNESTPESTPGSAPQIEPPATEAESYIPVVRTPVAPVSDPDSAPPAPAPTRFGETSGNAEIALQGYYLGGSQSLSTTTGVSLHFSDFLPGVGLLGGSLESYGADGRFRLGDNFLSLSGVVLGGRHWNFTGGDFHMLPSTVDVPFTNIINTEFSARGFEAQTTSKTRTITLFWGQITLLEGPRIPFRVTSGQQILGATLQQKLGERLTIGARVMHIATSSAALDPDSPYSALYPLNRQFTAANVIGLQSSFAMTKHIKFYGEASASFTSALAGTAGTAGTEETKPMSLTGGAVYDTPMFTARANYTSQSAAYLPIAGQFAGDRQGPFGELRYRPFKALEVYASASKYRNNIEDSSDVITYHSIGYSAGTSLTLPWKFSVSGSLTILDYTSNEPGMTEDSKNRQLSFTLARPIGRHNLRITVRDLELNASAPQHQRSEEIEDSVNWRRLTFSAAIRRQETIDTEVQQSLFFRGAMQAHFRHFNAYAQMEIGNDLANQTVFSTSSYSTTVVGLTAPVWHGWTMQMEGFRNRLNTAVNPENIFLLANQNNTFSSGLAGTDLAGFEQWSVFIRLSHQIHWGGSLPAGSNLEQFTRDQLPVTGSVEGLVSEPAEGGSRRVEGIPVILDNSRTVLSDAEGHYRIPNVPEGSHEVKLSSMELPADFNPGPNAASTVVVRPSKLVRVDFQVIRLGQISGHVEAPPKSGDDNDVETIVIRLEPGGRYTTPDYDGNFAFYNLPEGQYKVSIDDTTMPRFSVMNTQTGFDVEIKAGQEASKINFGYTIEIPQKPIRRINLGSDATAPIAQ